MNSFSVLAGRSVGMATTLGTSPIVEMGVKSSRTLNFASLNRLGLMACAEEAR
ncbi:Uncharacterised protein [Bordetella pertussis]|nr:Uncharacterised protein [Bordetella pertussis]CFO10986.1 Uncharacterised protein [Bordetella pertussis]CFO73007.1 Uncharacterised protein [Bordetella pertussis]CFP62877.1 Uncharacterised protein [Bordetella pertussis]CFU82463.1 Uncharacterised protein [Bordetella pertussis]